MTTSNEAVATIDARIEPSILRKMARNSGRMAILWFGLGIAVGCLTPSTDLVHVVANVVAGVIVLTPLGAILGFMGAQRLEVVVTGVAGALLSFAAAHAIFDVNPSQAASLGLIAGAIVGSTFVTAFYRLPAMLISQLSGRV